MNFRLATIEDLEIVIALRKQLLIDEGQIASSNIDEELKTFLNISFHQINMYNG